MRDILPIQLNKEIDKPLYMQLYIEIKRMIESGKLLDGEKLPPIRKMAADLKVNNITVVNAYKLLESNGYIFSKTGSGTFVLGKKAKKAETKRFELNISSSSEVMVRYNSINFASSSPDPSLFPIEDFRNILNRVIDRDGGSAFSYTEVKGYKHLRECISNMMESSGIICESSDIQIISGAQQGIDIIAKAMVDFGDIIITEKPTYSGAIAVFKSRGANIIDIPIKEDGIDIDILETELKKIKPKFIYVMTSFQNPTSFSYTPYNGEKLLELAQKYDFYIIEDDYLSDLYYSEHKPYILKYNDKLDRVILIKSFSKIFMPGMRIGFLIVPQKLQDRITAAKHLTDISTSGLIQRVFDIYIRENMLKKHIQNIKEKYYERYVAAIESLDEHIKGIEYYKPDGGMHLWVKLPKGLSSNMLYSECLMENVVISPGSSFFINMTNSEYMRLSFASIGIDEIKKGIEIIGKAIDRLTSSEYYYQTMPVI